VRRAASVLVVLIAAVVVVSAHAEGDTAPKIEVVGTEFRVTLPDGRQLTGDDLLGTILTFADPGAARRRLRIEAVQPDPKDSSGEIILYRLSIGAVNTDTWEPLCGTDADGLAMGFPLSGTWTPTGEHQPSEQAFSLTCTSGDIAKCVRMGYKPWQSHDGTSLWELHQACTRMLRADYCGDGTPHTRDGTRVEVYDTVGIQSPEPGSGLSFEAAWRADGAVCVHKVRIPEITTLDAVVENCPARLRNHVGPECSEDDARRLGVPLVINGS
jgi:ADYC domain